MSGIYLHIPFCKQACHYCDFHFSTNPQTMEKMVEAMCRELALQKDYLGTQKLIKTIYFGGGTPSLLPTKMLERLLEAVYANYAVNPEEVTLETNPDDLTVEKLQDFKSLGIDRLSIGIQSFNEGILQFSNRAHTASESIKSIELAQKAGFEKLSIDLMYGFPSADHQIWKGDLQKAVEIDAGHISSYCLTIEPKTAFGVWAKKGKIQPNSDDFNAEQFEMLQEKMEQNGYIQYEISNFGKPDSFAIHNSNYWKGVPYQGIGPSAHSFDGKNRQHNIANNIKYITGVETGSLAIISDPLTGNDIINEYILTSLRTIWGVDLTLIQERHQINLLELHSQLIATLKKEGLLENPDNKLVLTKKGKLLADLIAEKLFI
ncbi:radical SAM family heme chaperone HemW [Litoribacter ruber]|uniref:radical SAM family heme chaperone HemW n=1 Tax=Litoribacter ruber TaxID=702568 RepID=UPI001BD9FF4A|nr:radical SAM family heme chaperone HemW [Litoribacter ruber]MBT0809975.1 radical SAM family heme chaperone HemW [Litoribacter ruber]